MSKISAAHLAPLAKAIDDGLRDGTLTVEQVYDFQDAIYHSYLEQRVRNGDARAKHILGVWSEGIQKGLEQDRRKASSEGS